MVQCFTSRDRSDVIGKMGMAGFDTKPIHTKQASIGMRYDCWNDLGCVRCAILENKSAVLRSILYFPKARQVVIQRSISLCRTPQFDRIELN
jgi:hypothetical protein